jgi:hypothetical protein
MQWNELYGKENQPTENQINATISLTKMHVVGL